MTRLDVTVPFLDIGATYRELQEELDLAYRRVMANGWFITGPELEAFEREFADYLGVKHCIGVGNGLDALSLAMRALDLRPGDEVIVPTHTFVASWLAVTYAGGVPVPIEPAAGDVLLDPAAIAAAITSRTVGILPVHLYGHPADLDAIRQVADAHGLWMLEDAAQAHGARYRGRRVGGAGVAAGWSFYPGKNLGAYGDGGAVSTNDDVLAERVRTLRNYGSRQKYVHVEAGINSRLDELQAALLRVRLRYLDPWNARRDALARRYLDGLAGVDVRLPQVAAETDPVWHLFVVRSSARDALQAHLRDQGIGTLIHYPTPPHLQAAYAGLNHRTGAFPRAEALAREVLSLPIGPHLEMSAADRVVEAVGQFSG